MWLTNLEVHGFKALDGTKVPLQPLAVLIGPNGSGKSTILQAIDLLGGIVQTSLPKHLESHQWEYSDLPHLRSTSSQIRVIATFKSRDSILEWSVTLGTRRYPGVAREVVRERSRGEAVGEAAWKELLVRDGRSMRRLDVSSGTSSGAWETIRQTLPASWLSVLDESDRERFPQLVDVAQWAARIRGYFFLDPLKLRAPSRGDASGIGRNGELLAPFLARLKRSDSEAFKRLVGRVRTHYPRLESILPRKAQYGWTSIEIRERWNGDAGTFNARQVSDGLLRLIAVAAMHELPDKTSVLLLDEIENGLHPRLLGSLVSMLEELPVIHGTQVVMATHSPITLNYVESAESAVLITRGKHGNVRALPLPDTRKFESLRRQFDLGELWYNVGEERMTS